MCKYALSFDRQKLHAIPELGGQELKTSAAIKATLKELGIAYK
jgi:metal-dependent amidase/aminoacylase/carboxypeptidase family protein